MKAMKRIWNSVAWSEKALLAMLLALLATLVSVPTARSANESPLLRLAAPVHKMVGDPGGRCSAVMIAPSRALTAAHCTAIPNAALEIDGASYPVSGSFPVKEGLDLAVIIVPSAPCPCATLARESSALGSLVYVVGYPRGLLRVVTFGLFQGSVTPSDYDGNTYGVTDARTAPGNSGGGVFNDVGELLGISTATDGHITLFVELPSLGVK